MKHPIVDRLMIILTTVLIWGLVALLALLLLGMWPEGAWRMPALHNEPLVVRTVLWAAAVLLFLVGLRNLTIVFPARKKKEEGSYTIQRAENGELLISVKALENLVDKCISQHPELTSVTSKIINNAENVVVDLHVTLSDGINIPMAITALQKEIKKYLEACSGVHVQEVRVVVDATAHVEGESFSPYGVPRMTQPLQPERLNSGEEKPDTQNPEPEVSEKTEEKHSETAAERIASLFHKKNPAAPEPEHAEQTNDIHEMSADPTSENENHADAEVFTATFGQDTPDDPASDRWMMGEPTEGVEDQPPQDTKGDDEA